MRTLEAATVFLSALLLFFLEPLAARMLLPLFGGSAAVWIAALLFFQVALLLGYLYAHATARLPPLAQAGLHSLLLLAALFCLPLAPPKVLWLSAGPTARVLLLLAAMTGLPFVALASTGPLVQRLRASDGAPPWRLYALSNLGSLIGLFAHPLLAEPLLGAHLQSLFWSLGFFAFSLLSLAVVVIHSLRATKVPAYQGTEVTGPAPALPRPWLWLALSLCSSALLSSVTSDLTVNVAPVPLLWVLPLSLYLGSFVLCFESDRIYSRGRFLPIAALALIVLAWRAQVALRGEHPLLEIGGELAAFFVCAMALHGELARQRPAPAQLTRFYLAIALGGALGGGLVAVAAPVLLRTQLELPLSVGATALLLAGLLWRERLVVRGLPLQRASRAALALGLLVLFGWMALNEAELRRASVWFGRSFYGAMRVHDVPATRPGGGRHRSLVHGTTVHGVQRLDPAHALEPTGYYGPGSGINLSLRALQARKAALRVGIIGLGAGVTSAFCRPGDRFAFYEIDPLVEHVAREQFSFLRACAGESVALGDARLTLAAQPPQAFDFFALDAFSGDAVPVHLLTAEAFALYARHLAPGGVLALHVSNRFAELEPVVAAAAARLGRPAYVVADESANTDDDLASSRWVLVPETAAALEALHLPEGAAQLLHAGSKREWTDDYTNLLAVLF